MENVEIKQAAKRFSELIKTAISGHEVIITESGKPIAKLVAVTDRKQSRKFGSAKGLVKISDDFDEPLEDFREYM